MTTRATDRVAVRADLAHLEPYGAPQLDVPVRLNTNETPWPPPEPFLRALHERLDALDLHRYPDRDALALRGALGARFGLDAARVWVANGSNEVLQQLFQAYGGPDRRVLLFRPGYSMYPLIANVSLTPAAIADLDADLRLTPGLAAEAVAAADPDIVCVASPNNPTGLPVTAEAIRALHDGSRALVIADEAYAEFAPEEERLSGLIGELPRLVVVRTFSKAWRLAGLRLGYLLGPGWVVDDVLRVRLPYHLDTLTQATGLVALGIAQEMTAHVAALAAEREKLRAALVARSGVHVWPGVANFLLFRVDGHDGRALFEALLAHGVLVRDFSGAPRLEGCLRVTVGTPEENEAFLEALDSALKESTSDGTNR
jgi:histidinol-phosphate aminotransferase